MTKHSPLKIIEQGAILNQGEIWHQAALLAKLLALTPRMPGIFASQDSQAESFCKTRLMYKVGTGLDSMVDLNGWH